jgi:hypothetical protein
VRGLGTEEEIIECVGSEMDVRAHVIEMGSVDVFEDDQFEEFEPENP